jgi:hypothetical protein
LSLKCKTVLSAKLLNPFISSVVNLNGGLLREGQR